MLWLFATILTIQAQDEVRMSSRAYTPQSQYTLRVDAKVVEVAAVVRDKHGKAVQGLTKDDFQVLDDGRLRTIDHFAAQNSPNSTLNTPNARHAQEGLKTGPSTAKDVGPLRFLALFFDDLNTSELKRTQTAAGKFIEDALAAGARIGVFTTSGIVKLDFTTDPAKLAGAIAAVRPHVLMREAGLTDCPRITAYQAYRIVYDRDRGTLADVLYDAGKRDCPVTAAAAFTQAEETWRKAKDITSDTLGSIGNVVEHLGTMPGTREILLASSGFLAVSMQEEKDKLIDRALRADVVINALDSKGLYAEAPPGSRPEDAVGYPVGSTALMRKAQNWTVRESIEVPFHINTINEPMANLAESTGGYFFHNNNDLNAGFHKLGMPPEAAYRFSFQPTGVAPDGGYHKLKITAKGYSVEARPGYFAPNDKIAETFDAKIDKKVVADDNIADFPVSVATEPGDKEISVVVSVDITKLRFTPQGDRRIQRIAFVSALVDPQGKIAAAKEGAIELALTEATYKRLALSGMNAKITLKASPGSYRLREVVEEAVDGKMACSTHPVEVK